LEIFSKYQRIFNRIFFLGSIFFVVSENSTTKKKKKKALAKTQMMKKGAITTTDFCDLKRETGMLHYIKERNPSIIIRQKMDRQIRIAARLTKEKSSSQSSFQNDIKS
jgi:hypothetical protein